MALVRGELQGCATPWPRTTPDVAVSGTECGPRPDATAPARQPPPPAPRGRSRAFCFLKLFLVVGCVHAAEMADVETRVRVKAFGIEI